MDPSRFFFLLIIVVAVLPIVVADDLIKRSGRYIDLTTDLASTDEAETLVASFDAAVPQWIEFWNLDPDDIDGFKVEACVIRNRAEFERQGLIPDHVPDFPFGYAWDSNVWVLAQQSEYYTRHLLLHEGVHSLAFFCFDGAGPTWFREGTAELLATHSGSAGSIKTNRIPVSRESVPYWGRFKLMGELRQNQEIPTFGTVMRYRPDLIGDVGSYGWSWAATMMLHAYPETREAFMAAARDGRRRGPGFNRQLRQRLTDQWPSVVARWRLMTNDLDYGFDWNDQRVALSASDPAWKGKPLRFKVAANQGWQSVGVRVPGGIKVKVTPRGRVTLANSPKPWVSEPAGITFRYYRGQPLGQLQLCVLPNASDPEAELLKPLDVRAIEKPTIEPIEQYSWLLFRVNDAIGELKDNAGEYEVEVSVAR